MKEWICEEVPALTLDGKVIDTMLLMKKELIRCRDCKHYDGDENCRLGTCLENGVCSTPDWFCADGERW